MVKLILKSLGSWKLSSNSVVTSAQFHHEFVPKRYTAGEMWIQILSKETINQIKNATGQSSVILTRC